jgi:hypothetical protein
MPTEHRTPSPERSGECLEELLREFFAAEMPLALLQQTEPAEGAARRAAAGTALHHGGQPGEPRPGGRTLGLTAVLASLMLMASVLAWAPRGEDPPQANVSRGQRPVVPAESDGTGRVPVELRGPSGSNVPVNVPSGDEAGDDRGEFPELDIRILPIDDRPKR